MHRTSNAPAGSGEGAADCQPGGDSSQNSCGGEAQACPVYILKLEPLPGIDGAHALRELLKRARREHGLRCLACHELSPPASAQLAPEGLLDRRATWLDATERRRSGQ